MTDLIERAKSALEEHNRYFDAVGGFLGGAELTPLEEMAPELARLAVAAGELAKASEVLIALSENTSPFGGEIMQDRIERANENFKAELFAFREATKGQDQ